MPKPSLIALFAAFATAAAAQAPPAAQVPPAAQAPPTPEAAAPPVIPDEAWKPVDPANTLVVDTTKGRFVVEMHPELAPRHVARIKALARQGYYNGSLFYRVLDFMAQTGDKGNKQYRSSLPNMKNEATFRLTPAIPYLSIGALPTGDAGFIGAMPVLIQPAQGGPASGQPADQAPTSGEGSALFCPGTAAFAHGPSIDSANSQIFFMRVRGPNLEKQFTAWGRVIQGQDVVKALKNGEPPPSPDKMTRVRVMADMPAADRPRLKVLDVKSPAFAALLQQEIAAKGARFSICDVEIPVQAG
jgi:peptidylprolyl isomerase